MPIIATRASAAYGAGFSRVVAAAYDGPFGAYDSLASVTVGATAVSSVTFSGVPVGYKHLQIRYTAAASTGGGILVRLNGDTTANYSTHLFAGDGSAGSANSQNTTASPLISRNGGISTTANIFSAGVFDLLDFRSVSKNKTWKNFCGNDYNGSGIIEFSSGAYYSTTAVTSLTFEHNGGNFVTYSSFALYGVK